MALLTDEIEYETPVSFVHTLAEPVIAPGVAGVAVGIMLPVEEAALVPQAFDEVTDTVPAPAPIVIVAEIVPCPPVTDHPAPVVDHVYDVAPATAEILNVFPVEPAHLFVG